MLIRFSITNDLKPHRYHPWKNQPGANSTNHWPVTVFCIATTTYAVQESNWQAIGEVNLASYQVIAVYIDTEQFLGLIVSPQGKLDSILY